MDMQLVQRSPKRRITRRRRVDRKTMVVVTHHRVQGFALLFCGRNRDGIRSRRRRREYHTRVLLLSLRLRSPFERDEVLDADAPYFFEFGGPGGYLWSFLSTVFEECLMEQISISCIYFTVPLTQSAAPTEKNNRSGSRSGENERPSHARMMLFCARPPMDRVIMSSCSIAHGVATMAPL
jgi:hypothetical protein